MKHIIACWIFISCFIPIPLNAKVETNNLSTLTQETLTKNPATAIKEIPPEVFSFQGVQDLTSPVNMELRNGEVDISSVIQAIERIKESDYEQFLDMDRTFRTVFRRVRRTIRRFCRQTKNKRNCRRNSIKAFNKFRSNLYKEISDRLLYPSTHKPSDLAPFTQAIDFLDLNCKNCPNEEVADSIVKGSTAQYRQLYDKIKTKNKNCQKDILQTLVGRFAIDRFPKSCLKTKNKNHPICKKMLKDLEIAKERFSELVKLVYEEEVQATEAQANCLECTLEHSEMLQTMRDSLQALHESSQCLELKPGEEKTVLSDTAFQDSYTVKRELDGSYSVPLTLQFALDTDYDGPVPKEQVPDYYMEKVQKCIKQANQKMLKPGGEKLRIVIRKPSKNNKCEINNAKHILIGSKDHRADSKKYSSTINCASITHEALHFLGFCEEYQEVIHGYYVNVKTGVTYVKPKDKRHNEVFMEDKNYEFKLAYDCRVTQRNSIMSNQMERWLFVFAPGQEQNNKNNNRSLLDPGHFNSILYGGCSEKNKLFNECSKLAYKSSFDNENCMEKKRWCESQNMLGRNKQEEIKQIREAIELHNEQKSFYQRMEKGGKEAWEEFFKSGTGEGMVLGVGGGAAIPEDYQGIYEHIDKELSDLNRYLEIAEAWPD